MGSSKDFWEKASVISNCVGTLGLGAAALIFTFVHRRSEARRADLDQAGRFIEHLASEDIKTRRLAFSALNTLGNPELTAAFLAVDRSPAAALAVGDIATNPHSSSRARQLAVDALSTFARGPSTSSETRRAAVDAASLIAVASGVETATRDSANAIVTEQPGLSVKLKPNRSRAPLRLVVGVEGAYSMTYMMSFHSPNGARQFGGTAHLGRPDTVSLSRDVVQGGSRVAVGYRARALGDSGSVAWLRVAIIAGTDTLFWFSEPGRIGADGNVAILGWAATDPSFSQ